MPRSVEQLHAAAVDLVNRGRLVPARRMLLEAGERADDPHLRARITATLALTLGRIGDIPEAERLCREALATPGLTAEETAILAGQMGAIAELAGRLDDANRWLTRAVAGLGRTVARANILLNRSEVDIQLGRLDDAARDNAEAAAIYAEHGRPIDAAEARHNLGYVDLLRGELVIALQEMLEARSVLAGVSTVTGAITDTDRAMVLRDAGLTTEAERILLRTAPIFGRHRLQRERAETDLQLARSLLTHDPAAARVRAAAAARRFRSLGNDVRALRADALRLRAELSGGRIVRSGDRVAGFRRIPSAEMIEDVASGLQRNGQRNDADTLRASYELWRARQGLPPLNRMRPSTHASVQVRLLAHEVRAVRAASRGRDADARRSAAAGLDLLRDWQRDFGSLDLQTSIVMHGTGLLAAGIAAAARSGRPDVVFEWSERARHISLQVLPVRPPPDPELAADLAELRMLRAQEDDGMSDPRADELRERARERQWSAVRSAAFQERATLEELRARLDDETALLAYVFTGDGLLALVVTSRRTAITPLPAWSSIRRLMAGLRADLDMFAAVRAGPLAAVVRRSLEDRLAAVSDALLAPPLRAPAARRLVITVPAVLEGIPWAMLPGMQGHAFTLAASASRWTRLRDEPAPLPRVAGFAEGPRVARSGEEIATAAAAWTDPRVVRAASVDDVAALAGEVDVLHVASHGRHAVDNPLFSGLELGDGTLFGYDIDRMPRVPATVILSACEVGRSSVRWGEEAVGMTRAWLHAGTRCVIAAPVVVADDDACELLAATHGALAAGSPPAEALAEAAAETGIVAPFQTHGAGF